MTREAQTPAGRSSRQLAAYRRRAVARTPGSDAAIRRALNVGGPRGAALGLDKVSGIVWAELVDHGAKGVHMPAAQAHLEVWGGPMAEVFRVVREHRPAGVLITTRWHPATWRKRLRSWVRWRLFLAFGDPRKRGRP